MNGLDHDPDPTQMPHIGLDMHRVQSLLAHIHLKDPSQRSRDLLEQHGVQSFLGDQLP